jgi:uncharacterized membrane protein YfcA
MGLVGGGGAVLAVPVLVYVLGQDVHAATTSSLAVVGIGSLVGGARLAAAGYVCWPCALVFAVPAAAGSLLGTVLGKGVDGTLLLLLFAPVLVGAAVAIWQRAGGYEQAEEGEWRCPPLRPVRTVPAGFAVGLLTGFFGVGGGFVIVPTLVLWLGLSMRRAVGTSLVIVSLVSSAGLGSHLLTGATLDWHVTLVLAAATAGGALAGATISPAVRQQRLARGFAIVVACLAVFLVVQGVLGGPAQG